MTQTAKRIQQFIVILVFFGMLAGFLLANLLTPDTEISESERRPLAKFPTYSSKNLWSGKYFSEFEDYALDQFVQRDTFRSINAHMKYDMLFQKDNNNIFLRALNPYGFAKQYKEKIAYPVEDFIENFKEGLDYIIELNKQGTFFIEGYAALLLKRILTPFATGFVDNHFI